MRTFVRTTEDQYDKHYCYIRFEGLDKTPYRYANIISFDGKTNVLRVLLSRIQMVGSIELATNVSKTVQTLKFGVRRHMQSRIINAHPNYVQTTFSRSDSILEVVIPQEILAGLVDHSYNFTAKIIPEKRKLRSFKRNAKPHNVPMMIPLAEDPVVEKPIIKAEPSNEVTIIKVTDLKNYLAIMQENSLDKLRIPRTNVSLTK